MCMIVAESLENIEDRYEQGEDVSVTIAYHAPCMDGYTSALVLREAIRHIGEEISIRLVEMQYTKESKADLYRVCKAYDVDYLYILDFSLPLGELRRLSKIDGGPEYIAVLDHHKTAFESYFPDVKVEADSAAEYVESVDGGGEIYIKLDNAKSGAGITLREVSKFYQPKPNLITLVAYVQDRDLWKFELLNTKEINAFLSREGNIMEGMQYPSKKLNHLYQVMCKGMNTPEDYMDIIVVGGKILRDREELIKQYWRTHRYVNIHTAQGYGLVPFVMLPKEHQDLTSELGNTIASNHFNPTDIGIVVDSESDVGTYKVSLRSIGDVDVSAIAKLYGGGGHKNAAGFTTDVWPPEEIANATD